MLVRHLSYFVTLAKEQHFARAAEVCCVAQPTLSAAIRKLEDDLEIRLVVRGHRYLGLTPEGRKVLEWARQILTDYDGLRADLAGPHAFLAVLGAQADLVAFDLVEPTHSQSIGLVLSDRDPLSPMASAILSSTLNFQLPPGW